jgi:hypothetical protein
MATKRWIGNAPAVAQVNTFLFAGTWEATDIVVFTIGTKSVSVVTGSATIATLGATLAAAWNALDSTAYPEFSEITASFSTATLTLTADTAGKPFTVTISTTETGGGAADAQTIEGTTSTTGTVATANSGPNVYSLAANWDTGTVPVDADDIYFDSGSVDCLYDLSYSAVTPASITIGPGYSGEIGLPETNEDNSATPYREYRTTYLTLGVSTDATNIALTVNGGGGRVKINHGSSQYTANIKNTGQRAESQIPTLLLKGTHASSSISISKGDLGVAYFGGETSTVLTLNVGFQTNPAGDSSVVLGSGVTLTNATIVMTGGTLETNSATSGTATITQYDGLLKLQAGGQLGLTVRGGTCVYNSTGTLGGAPVVSGTGHLDFSQDLRAKTVTNPVDVYGPDAKVSDPTKVVGTLVVDLDETANSANINIGTNIRLTRGAVA